jgi:hypothetical protein
MNWREALHPRDVRGRFARTASQSTHTREKLRRRQLTGLAPLPPVEKYEFFFKTQGITDRDRLKLNGTSGARRFRDGMTVGEYVEKVGDRQRALDHMSRHYRDGSLSFVDADYGTTKNYTRKSIAPRTKKTETKTVDVEFEDKHPRDDKGHFIRVENDHETSPDFRKHIQSHIDNLPTPIKNILAKDGVTVAAPRFTRRASFMSHVGEAVPRGYPKGYNWDSAGGVYSPGSRSLAVSEYIKNPDEAPRWNFHHEHTFYHEVGHAVDYARDNGMAKTKVQDIVSYNADGSTAYISSTPIRTERLASMTGGFARAYNRDKKTIASRVKYGGPGGLTLQEHGRLRYFLQKKNAGRAEAFAELFADHYRTTLTADSKARENLHRLLKHTGETDAQHLARARRIFGESTLVQRAFPHTRVWMEDYLAQIHKRFA